MPPGAGRHGQRRGLGVLEVGEARHHRLRVGGGDVEQGPPEVGERPHEGDDLLLQPNPYAGRDLVVPGPAHVEAAAEVLADPVDEVGLFPGVDVLEPLVEGLLREAVVVEVEERRHQRPCRGLVDDPLPAKAEEVRHIHEEVRLRNPAVGLHRRKKVLEVAGTLAGETALPNLIRTHSINSPVCTVWPRGRLKPRTEGPMGSATGGDRHPCTLLRVLRGFA